MNEFPLCSNKKPFKKAKKAFIDFWSRWIDAVHIQFLFEGGESAGHQGRTGAEVMEWVKSLIFSMSSSSFRPFRHTAVIAALTLTSGLAGLAQNVEKDLSRVTQQLEAQSSSRFARTTTQPKVNQDTLKDLSGKKEVLDGQIMDFING